MTILMYEVGGGGQWCQMPHWVEKNQYCPFMSVDCLEEVMLDT